MRKYVLAHYRTGLYWDGTAWGPFEQAAKYSRDVYQKWTAPEGCRKLPAMGRWIEVEDPEAGCHLCRAKAAHEEERKAQARAFFAAQKAKRRRLREEEQRLREEAKQARTL